MEQELDMFGQVKEELANAQNLLGNLKKAILEKDGDPKEMDIVILLEAKLIEIERNFANNFNSPRN